MTTKTKRLNKELASEIANNVLRATFKDRFAKLVEEEKKLGDRVYLEAIPEEHLKLMRKLPATYFVQSYYAQPRGLDDCLIDHPLHRSWSDLYAIINGAYYRFSNTGIQMSDCKPIPAQYQHARWGDVSASLIAEIEAWKARYEQMFDEASKLKTKIEAVMMSVRTVKALLETWPECKPYIPECAFAADDRSMPMVLIADLNDTIKKAKCASSTSSSTSDNMAAAVINELIVEV